MTEVEKQRPATDVGRIDEDSKKPVQVKLARATEGQNFRGNTLSWPLKNRQNAELAVNSPTNRYLG
jgi:hypothetical protein